MISFNAGEVQIKGSHLQIMTDFNFIIEELLSTSPEIVLATFFARSEQLKKYIEKCNSTNLELSTEVIKRLLEIMEEAENEQRHNKR